MKRAARSFEVRGETPERVIRSAASQPHLSGAPGVGLLFLSGQLTARATEIAEGLCREDPERSWLIASAPGVLTERAESEGENVAAGMVLHRVTGHAITGQRSDRAFGQAVSSAFDQTPHATGLVFTSGENFEDDWLVELKSRHPLASSRLLGGGALPHSQVHWVERGTRTSGAACVLLLETAARLRVVTSSACRLLSPLAPVTKTRGALLLEIDGVPTLELLREAAQSMSDPQLILLAVAEGDQPLSLEGRNLSLRTLQGVDPSLGGILLGEELPLGKKVAFAVRDAHAARQDLRAHLRALERSHAGANPCFGLFINCAGRGRELYQKPDTNIRLIRESFPELPLIGLQASFELAPSTDKPTPQIYAGILALFSSPS